MSSIFVAIAFLFGMAISILSAMLAIEKKNICWNILTIAYGIILSLADAFFSGHPFDLLATLLFVAFLLIYGWLTVRFEVMK